MTATFYVGDAIEVMNRLPEKSVDLILTSPPFLALRSYLPSDHPDKALEGGSQSTPGEYIDWLLDVVEACDRVLAPHGSLCIELGDTYAGSGGAGGDYAEGGDREGQPVFRANPGRNNGERYQKPGMPSIPARHKQDELSKKGTGWPLAKSLSLIPESFRFAMVYGFNPHTGRTTEPWRLRNVIRWVRPNPPVGALGDKFRPATSELMVFCKSAKRYFDLDAVREPAISANRPEGPNGTGVKSQGRVETDNTRGTLTGPHELRHHPAGAPPLDWWNIPLLEGEEETRYGPKHAARTDCENCNGTGWYLGHTDLCWELDRCVGQGCPVRRVCGCGLGGAKAKRGDVGSKRRKTMEGGTLGPYFDDMSGGAPPLDWWNIPPGGYEGAHYAVWPPELCVKPVKAMCPERVCKTCGEPSRRIVEPSADYAERLGKSWADTTDGRTKALGRERNSHSAATGMKGMVAAEYNTTGFSDCGHDDWRPGLVLDCFAGSGTTLAVATGHGRDAIGIDLDERNYELALQRVGPFILSRAESV